MKIAFFGTPDFAVPSLDSLAGSPHEVVLVAAQPDRPAGRGMKMKSPAVVIRARELGLPVMQPERIRAEDFLAAIRSLEPDLGVVVAYGKILPAALLEIPPFGFINVHGSILPKYRGAAPIQRAIEAGENETGITIMRVDEELDHGPIIEVARAAIGPDELTSSLASRLAQIGGTALAAAVNEVAAGRATGTPQNHAEATYASKILKEEGRIDWNLGGAHHLRPLPRFDPWPGIFAENVAGQTIRIREMALGPGTTSTPGRIVSIDGDGVSVGTANGVVRLIAVQRSGRSAVSAGEFFRAVGLRAGDLLP